MTITDLMKRDLLNRLRNRTKYIGDCWIIDTHINNKGYSVVKIGVDRREATANRISASLFLGLDLDDYSNQANHKAECKFKTCWNPDHIYVGTQADNMRDAAEFGEHANANKTYCKHGHPFNSENTIFKYGRRYCRQCGRDATLRLKARKKLKVVNAS